MRLKWLQADPFKNYKLHNDKVEKDFLTDRELANILKKQFSIERLAIVKDVFVFCCYTGLAYFDVMNLKESDIIDGDGWIKIIRQKSQIRAQIPLLKVPKDIIKKYIGHCRTSKIDTVFPVFSNQKVNSYLKQIADICGIKKNLTSHVSRHTFSTTVTLSNGVPIETVSKKCWVTRRLLQHRFMHEYSKKR